MANDDSISVGQLYRKAKNALAREFRGYVWVAGEIKTIREHRGSWYITLVEPGDASDGGDISVDVACWPKRKLTLQAQLDAAGVRLTAGMEVRVHGNVTLGKLGKLQLEMLTLDTEALVGRQAAEKRKLYEALHKENLLERNRGLTLPLVPLRIGLVTSEGSEGCNDFLGQLERSGYRFEVSLAHAPVQGPTAANLLARAIESFDDAKVDILAVVRGGGGELDAFDKEPVARAIANCPVPVFTGVGHTGDRSVADDVAHKSFITPTECGQAIVRSVRDYLGSVDQLVVRLHRLSAHGLERESSRIANAGRHILRSGTGKVERESARLTSTGHRLSLTVSLTLERAETQLHRQAERARRCADRDLALSSAALDGYRKDVLRAAAIVPQDARTSFSRLARGLQTATERQLERANHDSSLWRAKVTAFDPKRQLERGYTLTKSADGTVVRSATQVSEGNVVTTVFADGEASSSVTDIQVSKESV